MYFILRLFSLLPYSCQVRLGRWLGILKRKTAKSRYRIADTNLRLCFPEWDDEQRNKVLQQHFESLGIFLFEFGLACWWPDARLRPLVRIEGLENLRQALGKKRGAILLVSHFTTMVIASRILKMSMDLNAVYRRINNDLADHIFNDVQERFNVTLIRHDDVKSIIRSMKDNIPIIYIPDRNFGRRQSVFAPFFGIPTATTPATSRLAGINHSPVLPVYQERLPDNKGYRVVIEKELENFPGDDNVADAARINRIIEEQIRQHPADYLWIHRRFKTRPEGEGSIYNNTRG